MLSWIKILLKYYRKNHWNMSNKRIKELRRFYSILEQLKKILEGSANWPLVMCARNGRKEEFIFLRNPAKLERTPEKICELSRLEPMPSKRVRIPNCETAYHSKLEFLVSETEKP